MNTITVIGNVGKDPVVRFTGQEKAVTTFSVATSTGKDDNKRTVWHDVVCFDEQAERVADEIVKGTRVVVVGRLNKESYEGKDGQQRTKVEIVADDVAVSMRWRNSSSPSSSARASIVDDEQPF